MSNAGQAVSTIAGGVVGFFVGGPGGAIYGAQLGYGLGTLVSPTQLAGVQGPRIEDFEVPASDPGSPVILGWGTFTVPGFRLYLGEPNTTSNTQTEGGKGPPEQDVTTFTSTQTLALGLREGLIAGVHRVWENGELVYDTREQLDDESDEAYGSRLAMSAEYASTFVLYLGTEDQLPDPTLELELGAGNAPGFRGLAYMVFPDRLIKSSQANLHPAFKIEVSSSSTIADFLAVGTDADTSWLYRVLPGPWTDLGINPAPIEAEDAIWVEELKLWVAVGGDRASPTGGAIVRSPDGVGWDTPTLFPSFLPRAVTWSPSRLELLAVGNGGNAATSPDGITWTPRTLAGLTAGWVRWIEAWGLYVANTSLPSPSRGIQTSPDGITWTGRATGAAILDHATGDFNGTRMVCVPRSSGGSGFVLKQSTDGINWTSHPSPDASTHLTSIAWGNGKWVICASRAGSTVSVFNSATAANGSWTLVQTLSASVAASGGTPLKFDPVREVFVFTDGTKVWESATGDNFVAVLVSATNNFRSTSTRGWPAP